MAHTYTNCLIHYVFSTKYREPHLNSELRSRIWPFIGGIAREKGFRTIEVGGHTDHVHALIILPTTITVAKAVQLMKGGSSKFVHQTFPSVQGFAWQEGYGAFTIGASAIEQTVAYIRGQEEHHRRHTFEEEYIAFLDRNGVAYDPRYVFD
ncbi:MAG TPA: IS200/IS605 family transposase [Thermoanaerobaculia bacterium]